MLGVLLVLPALAGGHYDPAEIARQSEQYARAADAAGATFRDRSAAVEVVARGLVQYEEALDLLGDRAPADQRERQAALEKAFHREKAVLQAFAGTMMDDFDSEFSAALDRVAPDDAVACQTMIPTGKALPGMPAPMKKNPECPGEDLSARLAQKIDQDPALKTAIDEILALEWPQVTVPDTPQAPVGPSERWIAVQPWFRAVAPSRLKAIDRADEDARLPIEAALEDDPTTDEMRALVDDAKAIDARTASARAQLAAPTLAAIARWNDKKAKKDLDVGLCANPIPFGGCTGQDATQAIGPQLREDKKVARTLP